MSEDEQKVNVVYRIHLACPRCGATYQFIGYMIPAPKLKCAACRIDRSETSEMRIEAAEQL